MAKGRINLSWLIQCKPVPLLSMTFYYTWYINSNINNSPFCFIGECNCVVNNLFLVNCQLSLTVEDDHCMSFALIKIEFARECVPLKPLISKLQHGLSSCFFNQKWQLFCFVHFSRILKGSHTKLIFFDWFFNWNDQKVMIILFNTKMNLVTDRLKVCHVWDASRTRHLMRLVGCTRLPDLFLCSDSNKV